MNTLCKTILTTALVFVALAFAGCERPNQSKPVVVDPKAEALASFEIYAGKIYSQFLNQWQGEPSPEELRSAEKSSSKPYVSYYSTSYKISVQDRDAVTNPYEATLLFDQATKPPREKPSSADYRPRKLLFIGDGQSWHYIGIYIGGKVQKNNPLGYETNPINEMMEEVVQKVDRTK